MGSIIQDETRPLSVVVPYRRNMNENIVTQYIPINIMNIIRKIGLCNIKYDEILTKILF